MTSYAPPTENVAIFDTINFTSGETVLTQNQADKRYLRFPNAQGTENLQAINVNGLATFNADATFNNNITLQDGTDTTSLYQLNITAFIENEENAGVIAFKTKDAGGISKQIFSGSADTVNFAANTTINLSVGNNDLEQTAGDTRMSKPLSMISSTNTDRSINNVFYKLQDRDFLSTTVGQIYANSNIFNYDNNASGGIHRFASDPEPNQLIPLEFSPSNMTIQTTNPPTCTAVQPAASDSSTRMPTTAWVQSAIAAIPIPPAVFVPVFKNFTNTQLSGASNTYSDGPQIIFSAGWNKQDIMFFRITAQISYNPDVNGEFQNTGNTMGILFFRPYYMTGEWGPIAGNVQYCSNTPSSVCAADRHICFYTPSYNIGNTSFFYLIGNGLTASIGAKNPGTGWAYCCSIEYLGGVSSGTGTVSFANGLGTSGLTTNNTLP